MIVLGKVVEGTLAADLKVGMEMELTTMPLFTDDDGVERIVLRVEDRIMSTPEPLYILGAGMHPWGKWGRDFTEYGVVAARAALAEAGLDWRQIQLVAGADTIRNGYPGFIAGSTFAQKLGWNGVPVSSSYAACASGSQALQSARAQILAGFCDVALVIGADTTPKGAFAPGRRGTQERPRLAAVPPDRRDEPGVLRAAGAAPDGPLRRDVRGLRPGEGQELPARPAEPECPLPQGDPRSRTCWPARWSPTRCGSSTSAPPPTAPRR